MIDSVAGHTPLPPASLSKVVTALAVVRALPPDTTVPVSRRAAAMPPSRAGMRAGQRWPLADAMPGLLLASGNDAAMALAERVSGRAEAFSGALHEVAAGVGMRDGPVLRDPAGLDGHLGIGGGNLVSAEDLALAARAALADPRVAPVVGLREHHFVAPDGRPRTFVNHNRLLWSYPGAVGVKTGYTRRAGHCLLAAARRDGRTVIAVVLGSKDALAAAPALLDRGFAAAPPRDAGGRPPALAPRLPALPIPLPPPVPPLPAAPLPVPPLAVGPPALPPISRAAVPCAIGCG